MELKMSLFSICIKLRKRINSLIFNTSGHWVLFSTSAGGEIMVFQAQLRICKIQIICRWSKFPILLSYRVRFIILHYGPRRARYNVAWRGRTRWRLIELEVGAFYSKVTLGMAEIFPRGNPYGAWRRPSPVLCCDMYSRGSKWLNIPPQVMEIGRRLFVKRKKYHVNRCGRSAFQAFSLR